MGRIREDGQYDKRYKNSSGDPTSDLIIWILELIPWWIYVLIGAYLLYNWQCNKEVINFEHNIMNGKEKVVTIDLNLRQSPNKSGKILDVLSKNDKVIASEEVINGWILVADEDTSAIGYVFSKYVK